MPAGTGTQQEIAIALMAGPNGTILSPFDRANQELQSSKKKDRGFWWGALGQSLATLLKTSRYGDKEQLSYLRWFRHWIMDALGPRPVDGKPHYGSSFTYDGSPLEYSLHWKEKKLDQSIRFTIEPCSRKAGTAADPLNKLAAKDLLTAMAKEVPGIDLTRFNLFWSETHVPNEAADKVLSKIPSDHSRACVLLAFDLERGGIAAKAYFNPALKAICTRTPIQTVVFDAIRKCNGPTGSYDASIEALGSYLETLDAHKPPRIFLLSNDCIVDSPAARVKVYVFVPVNTLAKAQDVFCLGGRLTGPVTAGGLKAVSDFWCHIFGLSSSDPDIGDKEVLPPESECVFGFEMRPTTESQIGSNMEVKMYFPGSWLGQTDAQICEVLSTWFRNHGHPDLAARYQPDLASTL